jgi:hypothetical protein
MNRAEQLGFLLGEDMSLVGDAGRNIDKINALVADGGDPDVAAAIFRTVNRRRVNPGDIWAGLSEAAKHALRLEFVGGAIMRTAKGEDLGRLSVGNVLPALVGNRVLPLVDEKMARFKILGAKDPVKAARLPELLDDASTASERARIAVRCASATSVPLHAAEYQGNPWVAMEDEAHKAEVTATAVALEAQGFELETGMNFKAWTLELDEADPTVATLCTTTSLLSGKKDVTLGEWRGSASAAGLQTVNVEALDFFRVSVDELDSYMPRQGLIGTGPVHPDVREVLAEALSGHESSLVTPLATVVTLQQEVARA